MNEEKRTIAIIGMGYVGLPLAVAFSKKFDVIGYDISEDRINELKENFDRTKEVPSETLAAATSLTYTSAESDLAAANFYILALPTPINEFNVPDFDFLTTASEAVGRYLNPGNYVVYESTVYPGATREICIPSLEAVSGLKCDEDFFVGYSPERISPADKNKAEDIIKVTSGSTPEAGVVIDGVYKEIITAGTYLVSTMEAAEACKVIENSQRDVNIGFMNEVAVLLNKLDVDTKEVLGAMKTKWNALSFVPGLVGGHCIGIDPYYLVHKAQSVGHDMNILKSTRSINDSMGYYVASELIRIGAKKNIPAPGSRALLLGATFKENCPDIRNSKPLDIKKELEEYNMVVDVHDPVVNAGEMKKYYDIDVVAEPEKGAYDFVILAVNHDAFHAFSAADLRSFGKDTHVFYDLKSVFDGKESDGSL